MVPTTEILSVGQENSKHEARKSKQFQNVSNFKISDFGFPCPAGKVVGERSCCSEGQPVRATGAARSENAGMSSV